MGWTVNFTEFRSEVSDQLLAFVWRQWSQMGGQMAASGDDEWAMDPEALLLLSFELGREEPRLFDETLDWLLVNHKLVSIQRLKNLCMDEEDRRLVGAVLGWTSKWRAGRTEPVSDASPRVGSADPLFLETMVELPSIDPAFLEHGLIKAWKEPSPPAGAPDQRKPINFAFRLRGLCGIGARAEALRILLGAEGSWLSAQDLSNSAGYAKRNVQEGLTALLDAGIIDSTQVGNQKRFSIGVAPWLDLFELDQVPTHIAWRHLFDIYRQLLRWMRAPDMADLSDYMLASEARAFLARLEPQLGLAKVNIDTTGRPGEQFWPYFVDSMLGLLASATESNQAR